MSPDGQAPHTPPASRLSQLHEWFWRSHALARLDERPSTDDAPADDDAHARIERARALLDAAARLRGDESSSVAALALYREAARAALESMAPRASAEAGAAETLEAAFARVPPEALAGAAGRETVLTAGRAALLAPPGRETADTTRAARALATALLDSLDARTVREVALVRERVLRTGALVLAVLALVAAALYLPRALRPDLTTTATWRTSSTDEGYPQSGRGGRSFARDNAHETVLLFHTAEESSPWIEFDLGQVRSVNRVRLVNRADCCWDRAAPLVVEVSTDARSWTEVARRDELFYDWRHGFPAHDARYVRIRAVHPTVLHLTVVEIH